jgi:hypothetical protein
MNLSDEAKRALRSGSDRIGAKREHLAPAVRKELIEAKLLGTGGGLTIKGSGVATREALAHEKELFG